MSAYDHMSTEGLQDELRRRDLRASGTREELLARLEQDDEHPSDGQGAETDEVASTAASGLPLTDVLARIRGGFADDLGLEPERIAALDRVEDGWRATVDVVAVARVPSSTDVLASYQVTTDGDGRIRSFERLHRFRRSEAGEQG